MKEPSDLEIMQRRVVGMWQDELTKEVFVSPYLLTQVQKQKIKMPWTVSLRLTIAWRIRCIKRAWHVLKHGDLND